MIPGTVAFGRYSFESQGNAAWRKNLFRRSSILATHRLSALRNCCAKAGNSPQAFDSDSSEQPESVLHRKTPDHCVSTKLKGWDRLDRYSSVLRNQTGPIRTECLVLRWAIGNDLKRWAQNGRAPQFCRGQSSQAGRKQPLKNQTEFLVGTER